MDGAVVRMARVAPRTAFTFAAVWACVAILQFLVWHPLSRALMAGGLFLVPAALWLWRGFWLLCESRASHGEPKP